MQVRVLALFRLAGFAIFVGTAMCLCAGCAGEAATTAKEHVQQPGLSLPNPAALKSVTAKEQSLNGADYSDELPSHQVSRVDTSAAYAPQEGGGVIGAAFAIYPFTLEGFEGGTDFAFTWSTPPQEPLESTCWLGLANWSANCWDWVCPKDAAGLTIDPIDDYIRDSDSVLLLAMVILGQNEAVLDQLSASQTLPPVITGVMPISGNSGDEVQFSAELSQGDPPLTYAWSFGTGANPPTSTDESPTVELGDPGDYACELTVINPAGEDTFPFTLKVNDIDHWIHTYGMRYGDFSRACIVDNDGNLIVAATGEGVTIYKLSPAGELLWASQWSDSYSRTDYPNGLAVDSVNNIYVAGSWDFASQKSDRALILKLSPDGQCMWAKTWDHKINEEDRANAIGVDSSGNVYFAGPSDGRPGGAIDIALVKLNSDGGLVWQKLWGGDSFDWCEDFKLDSNGNIHMAARSQSFQVFHQELAVYLKFDGDGNPVSQTLLDETWGYQVAVSDSGEAFLSGSGPCLYKFSSSGALLWSKIYDGPASSWHELALGHQGQICVGTAYNYAGEPGSPVKPTVVMLNSDGSVAWARQWRGYEGKDEFFEGLAFDGNGALYAASNSDDIIGSWYDIEVTSSDSGGTATPIEGSVYSVTGTLEDEVTTMTPLSIVVDTGGGYSDILVTKF